jgi:hypothetical protein
LLEEVRPDAVAGPGRNDEVRGLARKDRRREKPDPEAPIHRREHVPVPSSPERPREQIHAGRRPQKAQVGLGKQRERRPQIHGSDEDGGPNGHHEHGSGDRQPLA